MLKTEANHTVWWIPRGFKIRFPLSKQPGDVGSGTFLVGPQGSDSQLLYSSAFVGFWGYLLLRCLLSLVWWSSLSPSGWLVWEGGSPTTSLCAVCWLFPFCLLTSFLFLEGTGSLTFVLGHVPASLSCSLPHWEIRVSWLCVNQFCPWGWFSSFVWEGESNGNKLSRSSYTWVTSAVSVSKSLIILLSAQNSPLAFTKWLTPSHCPAPLGSSSNTSPRKSSIISHPYPHASTSSWEWEPPLCSPNAQSRDLWSQLTAQNSWLLPLCSCASVHLITSAWQSTEHLIYLCQVINTLLNSVLVRIPLVTWVLFSKMFFFSQPENHSLCWAEISPLPGAPQDK